ncbi:MAG: thioredoxin domain-containing protein [Patescibacteria group bacterium]
MKKVLVVSVIVASLVVSGITFMMVTKKADAPAGNSATSTNSSNQAKKNSPSTSQTTGNYTVYSEADLAKTSGTKLLFFHAPWCSQCRSLENDIKSKGVPSGVTIFKVDYDTNQKLRQKHGVTIQTTFVKVDDQGNSIGKFVAYDNPVISSVIENLL